MPEQTNVLTTSSITLPEEVSKQIWAKTLSGSVLAALAKAEPMLFGNSKAMIFDQFPRAEYVAEGAAKSPSGGHFSPKTVKPHTVHVTMRTSNQVMWGDDDYKLGVFEKLTDAAAVALARALDLGAIHRINPLTGTTAASITESDSMVSVTNLVNASTKPDLDVETAAGLVIDDGYMPSGFALDPTLAFALSTMRDTLGRKLYPDLGFGLKLTSFSGMNAAVSDTVSASQEAATATRLKALVGNFDAFKWGVQKDVLVETIEYGDPDGQGDLKRYNQVALRAEMTYGWAILDSNAFAKIVVPAQGA